MIELNYRDTRPIYEQIKDGIKQLIYSDMLSPDEKLPSVRELASKLAINPNTISRAYKELEQEGVLYTQSGIGTFINKEFKGKETKREELFCEFDAVVKELFRFSVTAQELEMRIKKLAKGGSINDSGNERDENI